MKMLPEFPPVVKLYSVCFSHAATSRAVSMWRRYHLVQPVPERRLPLWGWDGTGGRHHLRISFHFIQAASKTRRPIRRSCAPARMQIQAGNIPRTSPFQTAQTRGICIRNREPTSFLRFLAHTKINTRTVPDIFCIAVGAPLVTRCSAI